MCSERVSVCYVSGGESFNGSGGQEGWSGWRTGRYRSNGTTLTTHKEVYRLE